MPDSDFKIEETDSLRQNITDRIKIIADKENVANSGILKGWLKHFSFLSNTVTI